MILAKPWCVYLHLCLFVCSLGLACFGLKTWLFQMSVSSCTTDWLLRPGSGCLQFGKNLWHLQTSGNLWLWDSLFGNFHHWHCYTKKFSFGVLSLGIFIIDIFIFFFFFLFSFFETSDSEQVRTVYYLRWVMDMPLCWRISSLFLSLSFPFIFFVCCCPKIICFLPASLFLIVSVMCLTLIKMLYCGHWWWQLEWTSVFRDGQ